MNTSKLITYLKSIVIFQYHLIRSCQLQIHKICRASDLSLGVYKQVISMKVYTGKFYISKSVKRILTWPTYIVRPNTQA